MLKFKIMKQKKIVFVFFITNCIAFLVGCSVESSTSGLLANNGGVQIITTIQELSSLERFHNTSKAKYLTNGKPIVALTATCVKPMFHLE
jgi:hypothetical protein